jgi:hypothetical protein
MHPADYKLANNTLSKEQAIFLAKSRGLACDVRSASWGSTSEIEALREYVNQENVDAIFGEGAWGATEVVMTRGHAFYSPFAQKVIGSLYYMRECAKASNPSEMEEMLDYFEVDDYMNDFYEKYEIDEDDYVS